MSKRIKEKGIEISKRDFAIVFNQDTPNVRSHRIPEKQFKQLTKVFEEHGDEGHASIKWVTFYAEVTLFKE